jgi:hypothetical protein
MGAIELFSEIHLDLVATKFVQFGVFVCIRDFITNIRMSRIPKSVKSLDY